MEDLDLYIINDNYIQYMQNLEQKERGFTKVSNNLVDKYHNTKPYVGIVLEINSYKYFAPLTHPKEHYDDNFKFFNRISAPIKLTNGRDYGRIMFCYMLPLSNAEGIIKRIDINKIQDNKYKSVLMTQYFFINSQEEREKIINKANDLYKKVYNKPTHFLYKFCCAFELLEKYCDAYIKE